MNRKIFAVIWIFGLYACSPPKNFTTEKVAGTYIHYGGSYNSTLDLFKGGSYRLQSFTVGGGCFPGILYEESEGKWRVESGSISFSSSRVLDTGKVNYELFDVEYGGGDTLSFLVVDTNNETMPFVNCVVFEDDSIIDGVSTDFDGRARLNTTQGDRIEFSFTGMTRVVIPLEKKKPSEFTLRMYDSSFAFYRYFSNETWHFEGRKLVDPKTGLYFQKKWPTPVYHYE